MLHIICPGQWENVLSPAPAQDRRRGSWFGRLCVNPAEIKPTGILKVHMPLPKPNSHSIARASRRTATTCLHGYTTSTG
jgi:hypothetical protein